MSEKIRIEDLSAAGAGVGKDPSGRVVFIPLTVTGDEVTYRVRKAKKNFAEAELDEILTKSSHRVEARCPVFGRCGGCDWQHVDYNLQWAAKQNGICTALGRNKIESYPEMELFPADSLYRYRSRIQLKIKEGKLGYFAKQSHELVEINKCDIACDEINQTIEKISAKVLDKKDSDVSTDLELTMGEEGVIEDWGGKMSKRNFIQINPEQNLKLKNWVKKNIQNTGDLFDLYGGDGNLSEAFFLNERKIEIVDQATLRTKKFKSFPSTVSYTKSSVFEWLAKTPLKAESAILDPPRHGMGENREAQIKDLKRVGVKEVVLVGCDVNSWAKDLAAFVSLGWKIESMAAFDFFPQTTKVEAAARLCRT
jgi:23S rRNA (uracil1939-C5)-methyltransferase